MEGHENPDTDRAFDQVALNLVAGRMRDVAMVLSSSGNPVVRRASVLLAAAIEKEASRIGASGLMSAQATEEG